MNVQEVDKKIFRNLLRGEFGIEKESLRVGADGYLASTAHPKIRRKGISRDFGESQVEFISGVYTSLQDACIEICALQEIVERAVYTRPEGKEYVWTYSNPPLYPGEDSIRIAEFSGAKKQKTTYRQYLAEKYGKVKMLFSGVHLNFSMPEEFFTLLHKKAPDLPKKRLKSEWYLKLCDVLMSDSWLLVALTAASPVAERQFWDGLNVREDERDAYASLRNSQYGYWNHFTPELSYVDFPSYLESMDAYVRRNEIESIQELYYPIRLKPAGENTLANLKKNGVSHIELRMLDLNPMCCAGVAKRDLIFIHLLIAYRSAKLLWGGQTKEAPQPDKERIKLHKTAASQTFWEDYPSKKAYAQSLIADMKAFYKDYEKQPDSYVPHDYAALEVLAFEESKLSNPKKRYADQLLSLYADGYMRARMWETMGTEGEFS